ncbi:MAG: alpha/beta hydrolase [Alphaproteobacteria bacterium]|nr:alpha/beta hydrolase [Alphaproteobacteria bacterium]
MPHIQANGIELFYDERGDKNAPPILLIMGFGAQMVNWPEGFCDMLAEQGFRVIRFDNRDIGLSQKIEDGGKPDLMKLMQRAMAGETVDAPYKLDDMAKDAVGLLDALKIDKAHIVGASMGGMIAQLVAINHPERTRSLISVMSSSGRADLPQGEPQAMQVLMSPPPPGSPKEDVIEHTLKVAKAIGSPGFQAEDDAIRKYASYVYDRSYYPEGPPRQYAAIIASGDRVETLPSVSAPTLVIHGAADPLIPPAGGEDTAKLIPGARLELVEGMGHDLAPGHWKTLVELIAGHAVEIEKAA